LYYGANGITASSVNGNAVIDNSGSVYVASAKYGSSGYIATGLTASGGAGATITNSGSIAINGWRSYGAIGTSVYGDVSLANLAGGTILAGDDYYSSR